MLRAYLGGLTTGRLGRLSFLGFWVLLWVLFALYGLGIAFALGVVEPLVFEGLWSARDQLLTHYGLPVLAVLALGCLLVVFAQLNLLAKRIRDMGLPGWTVLLAIGLGSAVFAHLLPPGGDLMRLENQANGAFNGLLLIALLSIPGGFFTREPAPAATVVAEPVPEPPSDAEVQDHPRGPAPAETPAETTAETPAMARPPDTRSEPPAQ